MYEFKKEMRKIMYSRKTILWERFCVADLFSPLGINTEFRVDFELCKNDIFYIAELALVLKHKVIQHKQDGNEEYSRLYSELFHTAREYALNNLKGDELEYFKLTIE